MPMRVLAVADVYEALTSDRPYRAARAARALELMSADVPRASTPMRSPRSSRCSPNRSCGRPTGRLTGVRPKLRPVQ